MWTRENRRVFAVVEHLREQAGVPLGDAPDLGYYLVRDIGLFRLLNNAIDGYSMDRLGGWNRRANRRIISALTPHGGARGAVMLTVTLGEMLAHKGLDIQAQRDAVAEHFDPPPEDREVIAAVSEGGLTPRTASVASLLALERATDHSTIRSLPFLRGARRDRLARPSYREH
jgi:hypothetical protein